MSNAAEITTAMQSAQPGDTLIMTGSVWTDQQIDFAGDGAAGAPITLRPLVPGDLTLNGSSTLSISGDYLVADGLNFEGGALTSGNVVEFRGSNGEATNSRLTNSAIVDYNPPSIDTRYFWVSMYGQSNRVDHNYFSGQDHSGVTVVVWRDSTDADHHQIDNNHFADRAPGTGNGFETIRLGTSTFSLSDSFTVVENNLFERVDGEIEIISNKSGNNEFLHNTFRESAGTLTLRHANNNHVEGNFFLGQGKSGSGGVRVIGEGQTVINNYFSDLDGRAGGAIAITAGTSDPELTDYFQVKDAVIAHNTIVDVNRAAIHLSAGLGTSGRTLLAQDVTIANNLINSTQDPLFEGSEGANWTWEGNIAFGESLGSVAGSSGVSVVDPELALSPDGLYRPSSTSPAINTAASGYSGLVVADLDGQPRLGLPDVGADEFSTAAIVRKPLTSSDVGPTWLAAPPLSDCNGDGCVLQAEEFTSVLDPDGNGLTWEVVADPDALGGLLIKAPTGDRVDLLTEPHDTIATYDVEFTSAGTYTAYFRARGFSSSTDSIFVPDDFGVDPDNVESLSSDGQFEWEKLSSTFTITASEVGVPLEFRVAMREQLAEFDALVLHQDANLTDAELDSLFQVLPGDFNHDDVVDAADFAVWRGSVGAPDESAINNAGDGLGGVDIGDFHVWQSQFAPALPAAASLAVVPEPVSLLPTSSALLFLALWRPTSRRSATQNCWGRQ